MAHVRVLAEDIGVRAAGSENEAAAARYARTYLKGLGYMVDTVPVGLPNGLVSHNIRAVKKRSLPSHHPGGRASGRQGAIAGGQR